MMILITSFIVLMYVVGATLTYDAIDFAGTEMKRKRYTGMKKIRLIALVIIWPFSVPVALMIDVAE